MAECPFCGADVYHQDDDTVWFACMTGVDRWLACHRTTTCHRRQLIRHALRYRAQRDAAVAALMAVAATFSRK